MNAGPTQSEAARLVQHGPQERGEARARNVHVVQEIVTGHQNHGDEEQKASVQANERCHDDHAHANRPEDLKVEEGKGRIEGPAE